MFKLLVKLQRKPFALGLRITGCEYFFFSFQYSYDYADYDGCEILFYVTNVYFKTQFSNFLKWIYSHYNTLNQRCSVGYSDNLR